VSGALLFGGELEEHALRAIKTAAVEDVRDTHEQVER
jgi:hypothetical protein